MAEINLEYEPQEKQRLLHESPARQIFYGGAAGGGKAALSTCSVSTPFGFREIRDLRVGDTIHGADGGPQEVVGVYPQGMRPVYRVSFQDGASVVVDEDHLWTYSIARKAWRKSGKNWKVTTTKQIMRLIESGKHILIPLSAPVKFTKSYRHDPRTIDPWVLGALLGDGCLTTSYISFCSADRSLIDRMLEYDDTWAGPNRRKNEDFWSIQGGSLSNCLGRLGLIGSKSDTKFIPKCYKFDTAENRWELFRGLMDTDGTVTPDGKLYFTTTSPELAKDVKFLVSSLGGTATITRKTPTYTHNGELRDGKKAYTLYIRLNNGADAFSLERKRARCNSKAYKRRIVSIEPEGFGDCTCISVSNTDGLFVATDNFIVTHNSHALRWEGYSWALKAPGCQIYLFRRTYPELEDNHVKFAKLEIPPELATYAETRKCLEFYNNSKMYFCYCERDADVNKYLGAEMHVVLIDEASRMTPHQLNFIKTRNRRGGFNPPDELKEFLPRFVLASNPGGPAHSYLKRTFIDPAKPMELFHDKTMRNPKNPDDKGWTSVFIPAKIADNEYIDQDYEASFSGLPDELARAYREGDWDAVVGQALHTLSRDRHQLRSFLPPRHWTRFMSLDWGTARPFSVGWYAVSEGAILSGRDGWPERYLPPGAIIRYAEWYGWTGTENEGLRLDAHAVGAGILEREKERGDPAMDYRVADSQIRAQVDGPSVEERFRKFDARLIMRKSDKDRKQAYNEWLARLAGNEQLFENGQIEDHPMFFCTINCQHFWRTVPGLVLDENDPDKGPEDKNENHVYDEVSYAFMTRPFVHDKRSRDILEHEEEIRNSGQTAEDPYAT